MKHIVEASREHAGHSAVHVYVATDDPVMVRQEIQSLPSDLTNQYRFWFHPTSSSDTATSVVGHIREAADCRNRYQRTLSAVFDLVVLTRSKVFVGEFNSNWGRLIHTHRAHWVNGKARVLDVRTVFGPNETFWPR